MARGAAKREERRQQILVCARDAFAEHGYQPREPLRQNVERIARMALSDPAMVKVALRDAIR